MRRSRLRQAGVSRLELRCGTVSDPRESFKDAFGDWPTLVSEAPGRVNLIGDHTDYNELPVLPIALAERVRLWLRPREDGRVRVGSADFPDAPESFDLGDPIEPRGSGDWRNYVRAAATGARTVLPDGVRGLDGWIVSDLPPASGLSSSSALVVAVMHALLELNGAGLGRLEVAVLAARAERFVGTQGGGMDQAAALCGRAGHALLIEFGPLRVRPVSVPSGWCFVVAYTGTPAEKSGRAQREYNERVASCRAALDRMGEAIGVDRALSYPALLAQAALPDLLTVAARVLEPRHLARFRHTVTEATRVRAAVQALEEGDPGRFGRLMSESHESLKGDYGVSTAELDRLVTVATTAGAEGARLTGAGFGGSIVALAGPSALDAVESALRQAVSEPMADTEPRPGARVFPARASNGAVVRDAAPGDPAAPAANG